MNLILVVPILITLIIALVAMPAWIRKCRQVGLLWPDMNKFKNPNNVASSGGVITVMAFVIGVLVYIAFLTFFVGDTKSIIEIFALLVVIMFVSIIGLVDDLLGWKHGGLSRRVRTALAILASIPLIVINAGAQYISVPFIGSINLGWIYLLIIVPLLVGGFTTTYNFLAGFNGLEAGLGVIILSFLAYVSYATGTAWLAIVALCMVVALLVFLIYNRCPAKIFPGDVLTYSVGALIASMAILGNYEKIALFVFIPFFLEIILKLRGKLKKHSFGKPNKNGSLSMPYEKVYGLTHLSILILSKFKKRVTESDVVYLIVAFQIFIILLAILFWFI